MIVHPPRQLVWSTDTIDLSDPFQKRWLLRQTPVHGRAEDIRALKQTFLDWAMRLMDKTTKQ